MLPASRDSDFPKTEAGRLRLREDIHKAFERARKIKAAQERRMAESHGIADLVIGDATGDSAWTGDEQPNA